MNRIYGSSVTTDKSYVATDYSLVATNDSYIGFMLQVLSIIALTDIPNKKFNKNHNYTYKITYEVISK